MEANLASIAHMIKSRAWQEHMINTRVQQEYTQTSRGDLDTLQLSITERKNTASFSF